MPQTVSSTLISDQTDHLHNGAYRVAGASRALLARAHSSSRRRGSARGPDVAQFGRGAVHRVLLLWYDGPPETLEALG